MIVGEAKSSPPDGKILTVKELLADSSLTIPLYQRPYKWTGRNVTQLFNDIATHKDKPSYRLGTIVFHHEEDRKNIVDGQQRTITLLLAVRALSTLWKDKPSRKDLKNDLNLLAKNVKSSRFRFRSKISKANIHSNYHEILRIVSRSDFTEEHIDFLLNKCEVVTFSLKDVSEAFQFFDSQNARGRDLEPHDLLKAYHLREFCSDDEQIKVSTVARWENSETEDLAMLFSQYLYRIRNWSKGASARYFGKENTELFKGVNIETVKDYPYVEQLRIAHRFVNHYNQQRERDDDDDDNLDFPFNLDQIIINGRRFFEMTAHYQGMVAKYNERATEKSQLIELDKLNGYAKRILKILNSYEGRNRTGDRYVRTIFDCLLIYYIDKFGLVDKDISRAIEKIFVWAFSLRLKKSAVHLASVDNHVVLDKNMFKLIKDAILPSDFINCNLPVLQKREIRSTKTKKIEKLFRKMGYLL